MSQDQKLLALKQRINTNTVRTKTKKKINTTIFQIFTIFLIGVVIFSNLFIKVAQARENISSSSNIWLSQLSTLLDLSSQTQFRVIGGIKEDLRNDILPVTDFLGLSAVVENDLNQSEELLRAWLVATKPLTEFEFTNSGLISKTDKNAFFTDKLSDFLSALPELLNQTKKLKSSLWYLVLPGQIFSQQGREFINFLDQAISLAQLLTEHQNQILDILGHYRTKRMVIFNQNLGEARPTGGFLGSYVPIDISKGQIIVAQSQPIYRVDDEKPNPLITHPANWYYTYFWNQAYEHGIRNLNYFPCFEDSAKLLAQEFSRSRTGFSIEQMVFINADFLQNIIPSNFTIDVPGLGTLNSQNLLSEIERITSLEAEDRNNPKAQITPLFNALINSLPAIIQQSGVAGFLQTLHDSILSRDVQIWLSEPSNQDFLEKLGLTGNQTCAHKTDDLVLTPLVANISGDKRNLISQNQFNIYANPSFGATEFTLKYKQVLPPNPQLQRGFNKYAAFTFVGMQLPNTATNIEIKSPQKLHLPFQRNYYRQYLENEGFKNLRTPDSITGIIESGFDMQAGFVYTQPDGSFVAGVYIRDDQVSEVEFTFDLPVNPYQNLVFYGQPGLQSTTLGIGKNIHIHGAADLKMVTNSKAIQKGVRLFL